MDHARHNNVVPLHRDSPYSGVAQERRWRAGLDSVAKAAQAVLGAVPGRAAVYTGVVVQDETDGATADIDMVVVTGAGIAVVSVTGLQTGEFGRRGNVLTGHPGAARQVRQLSRSVARLCASSVGRVAATAEIPVFGLLALDGSLGSELARRPWFDLDGPVVAARAIDVVRVVDLGGYLRARLRSSGCRLQAATEVDRLFQKSFVATCDSRSAQPALNFRRDCRPTTQLAQHFPRRNHE